MTDKGDNKVSEQDVQNHLQDYKLGAQPIFNMYLIKYLKVHRNNYLGVIGQLSQAHNIEHLTQGRGYLRSRLRNIKGRHDQEMKKDLLKILKTTFKETKKQMKNKK